MRACVRACVRMCEKEREIYLQNAIYCKMQFIPVMAKLNFQQPLLQSSVSHDISENILMARFHWAVRFGTVRYGKVSNYVLFYCQKLWMVPK